MGIIWTIVLGFVIGVIAKFMTPGKENMGFLSLCLVASGFRVQEPDSNRFPARFSGL